MTCCCVTAGKDLSLSYEDPDVFCRTQWRCIPRWLFVAYRIVVATYFFGFGITYLIVSMVNGMGGDFFVFLTNWGFIVVTIYFLFAAISTLIHVKENPRTPSYSQEPEDPDETTPLTDRTATRCRPTPWYCKVTWCFFNVAALASLVVTLVYWPALSGFSDEMNIPFVLDFHLHALPSVVIVLELILAAMPIRMMHAFYTVLIGIVYIIMTVIIYYSGWQNPYDDKPYVYPFLDYAENPGIAIGASIGIFVGLFLLQTSLWALFKVKLYLARNRQPITDQPHSPRSSIAEKTETDDSGKVYFKKVDEEDEVSSEAIKT
ncbi:protein rolling stone-like [Saccoglossus kowalevskii]|uniref:Protein rolling stone-like n=1 Tax=Saccoglossus kowalevskii TaxID=10224 RepID=A0ABM0MW05_SACKO|nr:PREDICTED: protein rolling stone-like [Saccoglossus kowalevskii]